MSVSFPFFNYFMFYKNHRAHLNYVCGTLLYYGVEFLLFYFLKNLNYRSSNQTPVGFQCNSHLCSNPKLNDSPNPFVYWSQPPILSLIARETGSSQIYSDSQNVLRSLGILSGATQSTYFFKKELNDRAKYPNISKFLDIKAL